MKAVVAAFNQEKALVGAFSGITNLRMDPFEALAAAHTASLEDKCCPPPPAPDQDSDDFAEINFAGAEWGRYRNI